MSLHVSLGSTVYSNPIMVASGTFGYAREMESLIDLSRLGAIVPKTVTLAPRIGNKPPRTVETAAGMLNAIGLDNDGLDEFLAHKLPYLRETGAPIIVSIAAKDLGECPVFTEKLNALGDTHSSGITAVELNVSCPNVSGGVDFATDAQLCEKIVSAVKRELRFPLYVKLSPNVANIGGIALAAERGGADAICAANTCFGMAIDWKHRKPRLGNMFGGLSGPAIKPIALRCVHQIYREVKIPIIGIGGIATLDDVMEFFVAGASAVQIGTAHFYDPTITMRILDALPAALQEAGVSSIRELVGTLSAY